LKKEKLKTLSFVCNLSFEERKNKNFELCLKLELSRKLNKQSLNLNTTQRKPNKQRKPLNSKL
jgi:hypothetical protein